MNLPLKGPDLLANSFETFFDPSSQDIYLTESVDFKKRFEFEEIEAADYTGGFVCQIGAQKKGTHYLLRAMLLCISFQ